MPEPTKSRFGGSPNTHRIVVEFDDGAYAIRLVHPESGCQPVTNCGECGLDMATTPEDEKCQYCRGLEPDECWVDAWFGDQGIELLKGEIEVSVDPEWDGDSCQLHVVDASMPTKENANG